MAEFKSIPDFFIDKAIPGFDSKGGENVAPPLNPEFLKQVEKISGLALTGLTSKDTIVSPSAVTSAKHKKSAPKTVQAGNIIKMKPTSGAATSAAPKMPSPQNVKAAVTAVGKTAPNAVIQALSQRIDQATMGDSRSVAQDLKKLTKEEIGLCLQGKSKEQLYLILPHLSADQICHYFALESQDPGSDSQKLARQFIAILGTKIQAVVNKEQDDKQPTNAAGAAQLVKGAFLKLGRYSENLQIALRGIDQAFDRGEKESIELFGRKMGPFDKENIEIGKASATDPETQKSFVLQLNLWPLDRLVKAIVAYKV